MSWPWIAYRSGKSVNLNFSGNRFKIQNKAVFSIPEGTDPILIWDMRGIEKNRPDPFALPLNPKRLVFVDSGSFYGEDIIDCIMADRGDVILPLRYLGGFQELIVSLEFAEDLIIGIDWKEVVLAKHNDFSSMPLVDLVIHLKSLGVRRFLITILGSNSPSIPSSILNNLDLYFAKINKNVTIPYGSKGVFQLV